MSSSQHTVAAAAAAEKPVTNTSTTDFHNVSGQAIVTQKDENHSEANKALSAEAKSMLENLHLMSDNSGLYKRQVICRICRKNLMFLRQMS